MKHRIFLLSAVLISGLAAPLSASAQTMPSAAEGLMPPVNATPASLPAGETNDETHPVLNLMPDKSELVRLDREAASVIVGNPSHIGVVLDTPRLAVVIPRVAGATYFTVLDRQGNVIMQRHVIVAAPKKNYVRVRRSCANAASGAGCQPTSVYFCPDMCHEIGASGTESSGAPASPVTTQ